MTNSKNTKRALLTSAFAILLCFVMLIGTTFAWFTDSASTGVNKIQAGKLDVELQMKDASGNWVNAEGQALEFVKAAGHENEAILWEPGCTYELPALRVVNNGNLALKYKIIITDIDGDARLNEVIAWNESELPVGTEYHLAAGATSDAFTIIGHMNEDAGNEYQGLSINGIAITLVATQDTVEYDSNDNQYDANAKYPDVWDGTAASAEALAAATDTTAKTVEIGSASMLAAFANAVNSDIEAYAGYTITLTSNIDLGYKTWTPINMKGTDGNIVTFDGNGKTISNFMANGEKNVGLFGIANFATVKNLTVDNAGISGINHAGAIVGHGMVTTVTNCTVKNSSITVSVANNNDGDKAGAIIGWTNEGLCNITNCTVENCTVTGYRDIGGIVGFYGTTGGVGQVSSNTVKDTTIIQDTTNGYQDTTPTTVGEIVGRSGEGFTLDTASNAATNVTIVK